jgi:hypothetical protein
MRTRDELLTEIVNLLAEAGRGQDPEKAAESVYVLVYCLCCVCISIFPDNGKALEVISSTINSIMPRVQELWNLFDEEQL